MTMAAQLFTPRRLVLLALLTALGTALHLVEALLPLPLPLPGVKLGLANIVTLLTLTLFGVREGLTVALARVLLGSLLSGLFLTPAFLLALSGALVSTLVMAALLRTTRCFSVIGISMAGATAHNLGQLLTAGALLQTPAVAFYLPVLLVAAVPTGLFTGAVLKLLLERIEQLGLQHDWQR